MKKKQQQNCRFFCNGTDVVDRFRKFWKPTKCIIYQEYHEQLTGVDCCVQHLSIYSCSLQLFTNILLSSVLTSHPSNLEIFSNSQNSNSQFNFISKQKIVHSSTSNFYRCFIHTDFYLNKYHTTKTGFTCRHTTIPTDGQAQNRHFSKTCF